MMSYPSSPPSRFAPLDGTNGILLRGGGAQEAKSLAPSAPITGLDVDSLVLAKAIVSSLKMRDEIIATSKRQVFQHEYVIAMNTQFAMSGHHNNGGSYWI